MPNMNASPQQIKAAAAAGVELLSNKDLSVPLGIAMGGQLGMLNGMLLALANGDLVLVNPPTAEQVAAQEAQTEGDKPILKEVKEVGSDTE